MTFEEWMRLVDEFVRRISGLSVHDLPDCCFADWYEDGVSAKVAARRALRGAME